MICPMRSLSPSAVPNGDAVCAISSCTRRRPVGSLSLTAWARTPSLFEPNDVSQVAPNDARTSGDSSPAPDIATSEVQRATGNLASPLGQPKTRPHQAEMIVFEAQRDCMRGQRERNTKKLENVFIVRLQRHPVGTSDCTATADARPQSSASAEARRSNVSRHTASLSVPQCAAAPTLRAFRTTHSQRQCASKSWTSLATGVRLIPQWRCSPSSGEIDGEPQCWHHS